MAAGFFLLEDSIAPLLEGDRLMEDAANRAERLAPRIESYAKQNAPWSDRTGDARAGLGTSVETGGTEVVINLYHSVDYGIWLETIQSGRFAIIMPTLEAMSAEVFAEMGATQTGVSLG